MVRSSAASIASRIRSSYELAVLVRGDEEGPLLAIEEVELSDLLDPLAEAWRESCLRRGFTDVPFESVSAELRPLHPLKSGGRGTCTGFKLRLQDPGGHLTSTPFTFTCLEPAARRAARRLVAAGKLASASAFYYELWMNTPTSVEVGEEETPVVTTLPLSVRRIPLAPLQERARERSPRAPSATAPAGKRRSRVHFPVFYTAAALAKAERISRQGGAAQPPVETGGLLVGPLCSCPDTGELFAIVTDVLEATHTEATKYSLLYSGKTWTQIQTIMQAREARPETRGDRILGQCHGHQFLPLDGLAPCDECTEQVECDRSSAEHSLEDLDWMRAVFHGQPWQLSHLFGLNARGENVECLHGLKGGILLPREYGVLDDFEEKELAGTHR